MYDTDFFLLEGSVARQSAEQVIPWVLAETGACTVIDVGCGTGEWAAEAQRHGCIAWGVDKYVPRELQTVTVIDCDLTNGYPCAGFGLAICLEVAEHLPEEAARPLVAGLARAGAVLFSAATPGQPGVGHINCRPHDYWHDLFSEHGFASTFIGDQFTEPVASFYRRNLFLYTRGAA